VQDFVEGQNLEKIASSESETFIDEETLQNWALQLYDIFEFLHTREPPVIYRDLKPSNIIRDLQGRLHLVDFGISRVFQEGKDRDTEPLGSAMTASPEHYGRGQTDVRSDIFTLGATLHYLATNGRGRSGIPFEFDPVRTINQSLSPHFEKVLNRALELDPVKRFQTIDEMRRAHLKREPREGEKQAPAPARPGGREGEGLSPAPVSTSGMKPRRTHGWKNAVAALIIFLILLGIIAIKLPALIPQGTEGISMAAVIRSPYNPFFEKIEDGIMSAAARNRIKMVFVRDEELHRQEASEVFMTLVSRGVRAFLIVPEGPGENLEKYGIPLIAEANRKAIPVLFIHNRIDDSLMKKNHLENLTTISCDNFKGGNLAASYVAYKLRGKGKVLIQEGGYGSYPTVERRKGYRQEFRRYPEISVTLAPECNFDRKRATEIFRKLFEQDRAIHAVIAFSDEMALGAYDAAMVLDIPRPLIIGFDGTDQGIKAVREGRIDGTVDQGPFQMGKLAVENAIRCIKGGKVPPHVFSTTRLITRDRPPEGGASSDGIFPVD